MSQRRFVVVGSCTVGVDNSHDQREEPTRVAIQLAGGSSGPGVEESPNMGNPSALAGKELMYAHTHPSFYALRRGIVRAE